MRTAYVEAVLFTVVAFSPNVWVLAFGRLLTGFVFGNTGVMLAMLADVTPRRRLGLAVGIASAGFPLGSAIGPFLGGLIAQGPGIRTLLFLDALLSGVMGIVLTLSVREESRSKPTGETVHRLLQTAARDVLASPRIVWLFATYFLAVFGLSIATPFVPIVLQRMYHGPATRLPGTIGTTLAAAGVAMAITTPLWGRLGDLVSRWRVLPLCLAALVAGLGAEALAPELGALQGAMVGIGLFQGALGTTIIALLAILAPIERRASILNFALLPSQLSWFLAPITGAGLVALATHAPALHAVALRVPFGVGALSMTAACVIAASLALAERRTRGALAGAEAADVPSVPTAPATIHRI